MGFFDGMAGGILGGLGGLLGQQSQNAFNSAQASNQMDFQRDMSNTAHQREVKDLSAAGLNPILSGMGGSGASTPGGAMAAPSQNPFEAAMTSALNAKSIQKMGADIDLTKAQKVVADTQAQLNRSNATSADLHNTGAGALFNTVNGGLNSALQFIKQKTDPIKLFKQNSIPIGRPK